MDNNHADLIRYKDLIPFKYGIMVLKHFKDRNEQLINIRFYADKEIVFCYLNIHDSEYSSSGAGAAFTTDEFAEVKALKLACSDAQVPVGEIIECNMRVDWVVRELIEIFAFGRCNIIQIER